jgi:hypothetical protein
MLASTTPGASMSFSSTKIQLPKSWPAKVCSAMLHVVALAKYAAVYTQSWAATSTNGRVRLRAWTGRRYNVLSSSRVIFYSRGGEFH